MVTQTPHESQYPVVCSLLAACHCSRSSVRACMDLPALFCVSQAESIRVILGDIGASVPSTCCKVMNVTFLPVAIDSAICSFQSREGDPPRNAGLSPLLWVGPWKRSHGQQQLAVLVPLSPCAVSVECSNPFPNLCSAPSRGLPANLSSRKSSVLGLPRCSVPKAVAGGRAGG